MENMKKAGIVCCSNGLKKLHSDIIKILKDSLFHIGIEPLFSDFIYEKEAIFGGTAKERAAALMDFYKDDEVKYIFDISGGDVANGILPYLDYDLIKNSDKLFFGYSDLTTIINAIYSKTGRLSVLYNVRNLIYSNENYKEDELSDISSNIYNVRYRFIQQNEMEGIVVGGNIRCFLKLAGTEYMPDLTDKILLLESYSGTVAKMETYLCQLKQLGAFEKVSGIILGTFTEMEREKCIPSMETLVKRIAGDNVAIAVTKDIGHGRDSKAIIIGENIHIKA